MQRTSDSAISQAAHQCLGALRARCHLPHPLSSIAHIANCNSGHTVVVASHRPAVIGPRQAVDKASPYVRSATDTVSPYVKTAVDTVRDVAGPALRQAQPQFQVSSRHENRALGPCQVATRRRFQPRLAGDGGPLCYRIHARPASGGIGWCCGTIKRHCACCRRPHLLLSPAPAFAPLQPSRIMTVLPHNRVPCCRA